MCDTLVATPASTADGSMLFAKNSDRQRNETHVVELVPAVNQSKHASVKCTYIEIPQVQRTHAMLLCRPFWLWGAEMGANEHGVVIGNEGLHARSPAPKEPALTGMDLIRLTLERAVTAEEAVEVMTTLLMDYGQGGNCGHLTPSYYNNGFIIADRNDAFVLETVGREWLTERVRGVRAISNWYSIESGIERQSAGLQQVLRDFGHSSGNTANYADAIADPNRSHISSARDRRAHSTALLKARDGELRSSDLMRILRGHSTGTPGDQWSPTGSCPYGLCMHAGAQDKPSQTTGSLVSEIRENQTIHWVTGTSSPCISIFKPVLMNVPLPPHGPPPTDRFDPEVLWWRHEQLHRHALLGDFPKFLAELQDERDGLESSFQRRVVDVLKGGTTEDSALVVQTCWKEASEMEARWHARVCKMSPAPETPFSAAWGEMNELAGLPVQISR